MPATARDIHSVLLDLHKALIDYGEQRYTKERGPIRSRMELLQLLIADPFFAWLKPMSTLITTFDDLDRAPLEQVAPALDELRSLVRLDADTEFSRLYRVAIVEHDEASGHHASLMQLLAVS